MLAAASLAMCLAAARAGAPPVTFTDATIAAGVDYLHWDGVLPPNPQDVTFYRMCGGAIAADFDNDGWTDLYVTRVLAPNRLFRNLGNGSFEEVGAAAGVAYVGRCSGAAWGDVNNDGWVDLYLVTFDMNDRNYLYINNQDGTFTEEAVLRQCDLAGGIERKCSSAAFGDYDLDGDLDLLAFTWSFDNPANTLFRNDGTGVFTDVTAHAALFEPIPRDGPNFRPDIYAWAGGFADMNSDGWPEVVVAADFLSSRIYRNRRNGRFRDVTEAAGVGTDENGMGSAIGDYDNDGDLDWFVTSIFDPGDPFGMWGDSGNRLFRNDAVFSFSDQTDAAGVRDGGWGWAASFLDYDNDGDLDLAMTNGIDFPFSQADDIFAHDPVYLWRNDGAGAMADVSVETGFTDTRLGKGLLVFDYDRDGDEDVFIVNNADHPILYRNDGGNTNHWLQYALRGRVTNHFGIGARIYLQATVAGPTQMREINANSNFMSQNEVIAHFGFDASVDLVQRVLIHWPASGLAQVFRDVDANQRLTIREPCPGDADGDAAVTAADLQIQLQHFGAREVDGVFGGDMNGDLAVTLTDLAILLAHFGRPCE